MKYIKVENKSNLTTEYQQKVNDAGAIAFIKDTGEIFAQGDFYATGDLSYEKAKSYYVSKDEISSIGTGDLSYKQANSYYVSLDGDYMSGTLKTDGDLITYGRIGVAKSVMQSTGDVITPSFSASGDEQASVTNGEVIDLAKDSFVYIMGATTEITGKQTNDVLSINGSWIPVYDSTYSLGSSSNKWINSYVNTSYVDNLFVHNTSLETFVKNNSTGGTGTTITIDETNNSFTDKDGNTITLTISNDGKLSFSKYTEFTASLTPYSKMYEYDSSYSATTFTLSIKGDSLNDYPITNVAWKYNDTDITNNTALWTSNNNYTYNVMPIANKSNIILGTITDKKGTQKSVKSTISFNQYVIGYLKLPASSALETGSYTGSNNGFNMSFTPTGGNTYKFNKATTYITSNTNTTNGTSFKVTMASSDFDSDNKAHIYFAIPCDTDYSIFPEYSLIMDTSNPNITVGLTDIGTISEYSNGIQYKICRTSTVIEENDTKQYYIIKKS